MHISESEDVAVDGDDGPPEQASEQEEEFLDGDATDRSLNKQAPSPESSKDTAVDAEAQEEDAKAQPRASKRARTQQSVRGSVL